MPKKRTEARVWDMVAMSNARKIMTYARDVLKGGTHANHQLACQKLFGISYMHANMRETRSYLSHLAQVINAERRAKEFMDFLKEHLAERLEEIQSTLHPEDEEHLILLPD